MKKKKNENKRRVRECEKETEKNIVIKKEGNTMTRVREAQASMFWKVLRTKAL